MSEPLHGEGAGVKYAFLKLSSVVRVWFGSKNESFFFFLVPIRLQKKCHRSE